MIKTWLPDIQFKLGEQSAYGPIALEIARDSLRLQQIKVSAEGVSCHESLELPLPGSRNALLAEPAALTTLLKQALKQGRFSGRRLITALPADKVRLHSLMYRCSPEESDAEAILKLMEERLPNGLSDQIIDYIPVHRMQGGTEKLALVASAHRGDIHIILDALSTTGYRIDALEINPLAILRLIQWQAGESLHQHCLALNFAERNTYISLISNSQLLADQRVDVGASKILSDISEALEVPVERCREWLNRYGVIAREDYSEAAREFCVVAGQITQRCMMPLIDAIDKMNTFLAAETRGAQCSIIYLLGSLSDWPGLAELLERAADLPIHTLKPGDGMLQTDKDQAMWPVCTGLALRDHAS